MSWLIGKRGRVPTHKGIGRLSVLSSEFGNRIATERTSGSKNGTSSTQAPVLSGTLWPNGSSATGESGLRLELPWPPSVNVYWRHWQGRMVISTKGRQYAKTVADQVRMQGGAKRYTGKLRVVIEAHRPDNRKRDLDNLLKATLDALTKAGVWADDGLIVDLRIFWSPNMGGKLNVEIFDDDGSRDQGSSSSAKADHDGQTAAVHVATPSNDKRAG